MMNNFETNYGQAFDPLVTAEQPQPPLVLQLHPSQQLLPQQQQQQQQQHQQNLPLGLFFQQPQQPLQTPLILLSPHHHQLAGVQTICVPAPVQPSQHHSMPAQQQPAPLPQLQTQQSFWNPSAPPHVDGPPPTLFTQNPMAGAVRQQQQAQTMGPRHGTLVGHPISRPSHRGDLRPGQYDPDQAVHYILNGVNPELSQEVVEGLLTPYGVTRVRLVFGRARDNAPLTRSMGFAYVDFATPRGAKAAVAALNGSTFFGSELKLHVSRKDFIQ